MRKALTFVLLLLLLSVVVQTTAQDLPLRVLDAQGRELTVVEAYSFNDALYLPVAEVLTLFEGKYRYIPLTKRLTLNLDETTINLIIDQSMVQVVGTTESYQLLNPPLLFAGKPMLPVEFLTEVLSKILPQKILFSPQTRTLQFKKKTVLPKVVQPIEEMPFDVPRRTNQVFLVLDPGHGGKDGGVKGPTGLLEKNLTLKLARHVQAFCEEQGIKVFLTRQSDEMLTPSQRAEAANRSGGLLFLSLHFNASFSKNQSGFRIYLPHPVGRFNSQDSSLFRENRTSQTDFLAQNRRFAQLLQFELETVGLLGEPPTEIPLITLNSVAMPAVLLEASFLSNPLDAARCSDSEFFRIIAQAVLNAVHQFRQSQ